MYEMLGKIHVHDIGNIATIVFENVGGGGLGVGTLGVLNILDWIVKIYTCINIIFFFILLTYIMNII